MLLYLCVDKDSSNFIIVFVYVGKALLFSAPFALRLLFFSLFRWTSFPAFSMGKPVKFHHPQNFNDIQIHIESKRNKMDFCTLKSITKTISHRFFGGGNGLASFLHCKMHEHWRWAASFYTRSFVEIFLSWNSLCHSLVRSITFFLWFDDLRGIIIAIKSHYEDPNGDEMATKTIPH